MPSPSLPFVSNTADVPDDDVNAIARARIAREMLHITDDFPAAQDDDHRWRSFWNDFAATVVRFLLLVFDLR